MKHIGSRVEDLKRRVSFHGSIDVLASHLAALKGYHLAFISSRNEFLDDVNLWADLYEFSSIQKRTLADLIESKDDITTPAAVVDMTPGMDIAPLLDSLLEFRKIRPDVAVILVSEEVNNHDFGTDRLRICDVTLKGPVEPAILSLGVSEALINNAKWREKISSKKRMVHSGTISSGCENKAGDALSA